VKTYDHLERRPQLVIVLVFFAQEFAIEGEKFYLSLCQKAHTHFKFPQDQTLKTIQVQCDSSPFPLITSQEI
jgi:hypothetical protein